MNKNPINPKETRDIISSELERDLLGLLVQGYSTLKKHLNLKRELLETCSKCGSNQIKTKWCPSTSISHGSGLQDHHGKEVLHKWCSSCQYNWLENILS